MNYHNITTDDMKNGVGLRVVLWVSGCTMKCEKCFNPQTWDKFSGIPFTDETMDEILDKLDKPYIDGLTISGGHPLEHYNIDTVIDIARKVKTKMPDKTIWIYTGYTYEYIISSNNLKFFELLKYTDVLVDGRFAYQLLDVNLPYRGSTNQRLIDVQASLKRGEIISYDCKET